MVRFWMVGRGRRCMVVELERWLRARTRVWLEGSIVKRVPSTVGREGLVVWMRTLWGGLCQRVPSYVK